MKRLHHLLLQAAVAFLLVLGIVPTGIFAHEGPPFPLLMDEPISGCKMSIWADPDIGEAKFFIILETPDGDRPDTAPQVQMWTKPVNGRLGQAVYPALLQDLRSSMQFLATPVFDQRDQWEIGFQVVSPDGTSEEVVTEVLSTPPGYGPWDLAIYVFPFLLLGGTWVFAMVKRVRLLRDNDAIAVEEEFGEDEQAKTVPVSDRQIQMTFELEAGQ